VSLPKAASRSDGYQIKKSLGQEGSGQNPWQLVTSGDLFNGLTGSSSAGCTYTGTSNATYTIANAITLK